MADEMEEIEARLAAYVDGTLPAEQCAEIEAYFKANPAHAKLIRELQSIRSAVRTLPAEKAPAEVLDTLQSHLERHTLLGDAEEEPSLKINRWPQLGAVAAVLLLTAGLGVLVYQVLPKQRQANNDLAILSGNASRPGEEGVSLEGGSLEGTARDRVTEARPSGAMSKAATSAPDEGTGGAIARSESRPQAAAAPQASPPLTQSRADATAQNRFQFGDAMTTRPDAETVAGAAVLHSPPAAIVDASTRPMTDAVTPGITFTDDAVVVTSDDPALTANLLAAELMQRGIGFKKVNPVPGTASISTAGSDAGRLAAITQRLQTGHDVPPGEPEVLYASAMPLLVSGVTADTTAKVESLLKTQRPGRQTVSVPVKSYAFDTATTPTTAPSMTAPTIITPTTAASATTQPATNPPDVAATARADDRTLPQRDPTTRPFFPPADQRVRSFETRTGDVFVLILPAPAATSGPATTRPAATVPAGPMTLDETP